MSGCEGAHRRCALLMRQAVCSPPATVCAVAGLPVCRCSAFPRGSAGVQRFHGDVHRVQVGLDVFGGETHELADPVVPDLAVGDQRVDEVRGGAEVIGEPINTPQLGEGCC